MSIATKTGDTGVTSLLYGRRVNKTDTRIRAIGEVDELSAALGLVKATAGKGELYDLMETIQRDLLDLCPGLVADTQDRDRFQDSNLPKLGPAALIHLEEKIAEIESRGAKFQAFVLPGKSMLNAHLHLARCISRRAERSTLAIRELGFLVPPMSLRYLNRLADLLWLLAETGE